MTLRASDSALTDIYDTALLDLDGVIYVGQEAIPGVPDALTEARRRGMHLAFVTNNASRTPDSVAQHLTELGIDAGPDDVVTSAQAAAGLLSQMLSPGSAVLVVGGIGLAAALEERGLHPVQSADDGPRAVVQGWTPELNWRVLAEGAYAVRAGLPWVAANVDATIPTPRGIAPGNGAFVDVVATAAGRRPDAVAGKPARPLHDEAVKRTGAQRALVVGDRLDTDIEGANAVQNDSLLVLSGVTRPRDLLTASSNRRPTYVSEDAGGLLERHEAPVYNDQATWSCGGWVVEATSAELKLTGSGHRIDALRALSAATWETGRRVDDELLVQAGLVP